MEHAAAWTKHPARQTAVAGRPLKGQLQLEAQLAEP